MHKLKRNLANLIYLEPTPRILLFYFAIPIQLLAAAISGIGFVQGSSVFYLTGSFIWLVWFVLMFFIAIPFFDKLKGNHFNQLRRGALIIYIIFMVFGVVEMVGLIGYRTVLSESNVSGFSKIWVAFERGFGYNDATSLDHQAADNFIAGKNPYTNSNVVTALMRFNNYADRVTPLREGAFTNSFPYPSSDLLNQVWQKATQNPQQIPIEYASKMCYPAGSFLIPSLFIIMGVSDLRIVFAVLVIAALVYIAYLIPSSKKLLFIGILLISFDLWNSIANGETGSMVFPFLLVAFVLTNRKLWLSALFMGIAVATKQTAWFFLPFYLIMVFKTANFKKLILVGSVIAGIFLATNVPFILEDPNVWFTSVFTPMSGNMFPLGIGVITLVTGRILDIRSSLPFDIMEFTVLAAGIIWYFFNYRRFPNTGPFLAILPLFFAWRSLWCYFFYTGIIVLALIMLNGEKVTIEEKITPISP